MNDEQKQYSVADYLTLLNETLRLIPDNAVQVVGEVSDYRISQGKWINFDLKDAGGEAKISCFTTVYKQRFPLEDGMQVAISGYAQVYARFGKLSFTVESVELLGEGALLRAYQLLKAKLESEGLFDSGRKRAIPRFPRRIGLITSSEAAAYGDFLRILGHRFGGLEIVHIPVHVQGQLAVREIVSAFTQFNEMTDDERPEVIVLTRGGGSLEDLHAFNDEETARAVFHSRAPVVVGVGHERDESLCDFVADRRASTPSHAAELLVPNRTELLREVDSTVGRIEDRLHTRIHHGLRSVDRSISILDAIFTRRVQEIRMLRERFLHAFERFRLSLVATREHFERRERTIVLAVEGRVKGARQAVDSLSRLFESFNVQTVLDRGFALVRSENGKVLRDASALAGGDVVEIQLKTGKTLAEIRTYGKKTTDIR